jgi:hypothetical protein
MKTKVIILVPLILIFTLQLSFAQINTTTSIDKFGNSTAVITEDSIVGEKLEQVQNQSNITGNIVMNSGQKNK